MQGFEKGLLHMFIKELNAYKPFTPEEEREYFLKYKKNKSKKVKEEIILHNQRLVYRIANQFTRSGQSILDLISEGNIGLSLAVDHYDIEKNIKFSTYAYLWIKSKIERYVYKNSFIVNIPVYHIELRLKILEYIREFYYKYNRKPDIEEIKEHFKLNKNEYLVDTDLFLQEYSLSYKIEDDSDEFIEYLNNIDYCEEIEMDEKQRKLDRIHLALNNLEKPYKDVIILRFGLDGQGFRTLEEVSKICKITKESVRQKIDRAVIMIKKEFQKNKEWIMDDIRSLIRDVPDFPKKGIIFKDITTLLKDTYGFKIAIDEMLKIAKKLDFDKIAAIESRGFVFGSCLSYLMDKPFIPVRKKGKLPADTVSEEYALEYGTDILEMHKDAIEKGDKFLIIDDLLATGGTISAVKRMIENNGAIAVAGLMLVELKFLEGRKAVENLEIFTIIQY